MSGLIDSHHRQVTIALDLSRRNLATSPDVLPRPVRQPAELRVTVPQQLVECRDDPLCRDGPVVVAVDHEDAGVLVVQQGGELAGGRHDDVGDGVPELVEAEVDGFVFEVLREPEGLLDVGEVEVDAGPLVTYFAWLACREI